MKATEKQRNSVKGLLSFVEEVAGIRQAKIQNIEHNAWCMYLKELDKPLPGISSVWHKEAPESGVILRIERLTVPVAPELTDDLLELVQGNWSSPDWIPAWEEPFGSLTEETDLTTLAAEETRPDGSQHDENSLNARVRYFERLKTLVPLRDAWLSKRAQWLEARRTVLENNALFDRFQTLRELVNESHLKSECVLGSFMFENDPALTTNVCQACYPLVVRPLRLTLVSSRRNLPMIEVEVNDEEPPKLLESVVQTFAEEKISFQPLQQISAFLANEQPDILRSEELSQLMQKTAVELSTACRWHEPDTPLEGIESGVKFRITPSPVILMQDRPTGVKEAIHAIKDEIDRTENIPAHMLEIVCSDVQPVFSPEPDTLPGIDEMLAATAGEDEEILLTKPANTDQLAIAREIMRNNVVLVQGPPGTGKTHTIANLLGHFLAQGKRVLVTSHTSKALSVLKEKLPEEIQPLCVSMLGDRKDFEATALSLKEKLGSLSTAVLNARIESLESDRRRMMAEQRDVRQKIYSTRLADNQGPVYMGVARPIRELARELHETEALDAVIPGPVAAGPLPLTPAEFETLYATNGFWSPEDELELERGLPELDGLPDPARMREMCAESRRITAEMNSDTDEIAGVTPRSTASGDRFIEYVLTSGRRVAVREDAAGCLETDAGLELLMESESDPVVRYALTAGFSEPAMKDVLAELAGQLEKAAEAFRAHETEALKTGREIAFSEGADLDAIRRAARWFIENAPDGRVGLMGRLAGIFNAEAREARETIALVTVDAAAPASREAFEAVVREADYIDLQKEAASSWNRVAERAGAAAFEEQGRRAVLELGDRYARRLREAGAWFSDVWAPLEARLCAAGLEIDRKPFRPITQDVRSAETVERIRRFVSEDLKPIRTYRTVEAEHAAILRWQEDVRARIPFGSSATPLQNSLRDAVLTDPDAWEAAHARLSALHSQKERFAARGELLDRLGKAAPAWKAAFIDRRITEKTPPIDLLKAWDWKQLDMLHREWTSCSPEELRKRSSELSKEIRTNTAALAAAKAWLSTKKRLEGTSALANLTQLTTFMKRALGKGSKAAIARREANRILPTCQQAVPVWIMMIQDALLNFNSSGKFDIIIVDEASQADLTAIPILAMGEKIIVVGDDKQVTPLAIGTKDDAVDKLRQLHLDGRVKVASLYDAKLSLYGIIQNMAFPAHMLREHFRCVPEIIGFCNRLSYDGAIKPLRDASSSRLKPAIVPVQVEGEVESNGRNRKEAKAVVSLIRAMTRDPAYEGKTFGVICMRSGKQNQINEIRTLLMTEFDPREIEERGIVCGSSAEFQGDERDVILLSMVDSAEPGEMLRKEGMGTEDSTRKRYNVAVSRARDQLWIVHSFNADTQLKHDDIRRMLFSWAREATSGEPDEARIRSEADSEFEVQVASALIKRGYSVEQQHRVGSYRIDMVIRDHGKAVALECDGERYHSGDRIREDMERQTVLERNGWRFIRLRGAEYFRNPEAALERVCRDLDALDIHPDDSRPIDADTTLVDRIKAEAERIARGETLDPVDSEKTWSATPATVDPTSAGEDEAPANETEAMSEAATGEETDEHEESASETPVETEGAADADEDRPETASSAAAGTIPDRRIRTRFDRLCAELDAWMISYARRDGEEALEIVIDGRTAVSIGTKPDDSDNVVIAFAAVKGVRARGLPSYATSEDQHTKYWTLDAATVGSNAKQVEAMFSYLVRLCRQAADDADNWI